MNLHLPHHLPHPHAPRDPELRGLLLDLAAVILIGLVVVALAVAATHGGGLP